MNAPTNLTLEDQPIAVVLLPQGRFVHEPRRRVLAGAAGRPHDGGGGGGTLVQVGTVSRGLQWEWRSIILINVESLPLILQ